jgi:hypothetical protein
MSPALDVALLTPRFFDTPWTPSKAEKGHHTRYVPLAFADYGRVSWNITTSTTGNNHNYNNKEWSRTAEPVVAKRTSNEPPATIAVDKIWADDVSLLNDDPDEDDAQLLPHSTYNVLAPLFDEIYKDDSELDDDDDE